MYIYRKVSFLFLLVFKPKHKHDNSLLLNKSNANREALKPSHNFVYIPQKELTFSSFLFLLPNETFQKVWHKQNRANFLNIRKESTFLIKIELTCSFCFRRNNICHSRFIFDNLSIFRIIITK